MAMAIVARGEASGRPGYRRSPECASRRFEITRLEDRAQVQGAGRFPPWLEAYIKVGAYGPIGGLILFIGAFLTNSVPDPSFPGATLPDSLRIPFPQPLIERWPVSYTIAIWLFVLLLPAGLLAGYRRFGTSSRRGANLWLGALPAIAMLPWTTYCRFLWPKRYPPTWNAPAYSFLCWLYCAACNPLWSDVALGVAGLGVIASLLTWRRSQRTSFFLTAFGLLSLPLGIPALFEAFLRCSPGRD